MFAFAPQQEQEDDEAAAAAAEEQEETNEREEAAEEEGKQCCIGSENGKWQPAGWAFIIMATGIAQDENQLVKLSF